MALSVSDITYTYSTFSLSESGIYVWQGKTPGISKEVLIRQKTRGKVGLLDPASHYTATHMAQVIDWCKLGKWDCSQVPLVGIPWAGQLIPKPTPETPINCHPVQKHFHY